MGPRRKLGVPEKNVSLHLEWHFIPIGIKPGFTDADDFRVFNQPFDLSSNFRRRLVCAIWVNAQYGPDILELVGKL